MSSKLDGEPSNLIFALRRHRDSVFAIHVTAAVICAQLPLAMLTRLVILLAILGSLMWNVVIFWRRTPQQLLWSPEEGWRSRLSRHQPWCRAVAGSLSGELVCHCAF